MAPADRRLAIIRAVLPLLEEFGPAVTTRQIAEAAGIAEGTVFRAFPDKETLLREAVGCAFDPASMLGMLDDVDPTLPLEARVLSIVQALQTRLTAIFRLMMAMRSAAPDRPPPPGDSHRVHGGDPVLARIEELLAPDAAAFRTALPDAVQALRLLTFAGTHPRITHDDPWSPERIVDLFLHGALAPTGTRAPEPTAKRTAPTPPSRPSGAAAC